MHELKRIEFDNFNSAMAQVKQWRDSEREATAPVYEEATGKWVVMADKRRRSSAEVRQLKLHLSKTERAALREREEHAFNLADHPVIPVTFKVKPKD